MSETMQRLRGTGRTTRMLEYAKTMARVGRAVYVIADNTRDQQRLEILCGEPTLGIKFETPDSPGNFVWEEMRLRGAHPNCGVLVDHHAIEGRFARVLAMLHAYDAPAGADTALLNWLEENNGRLHACDCKRMPTSRQPNTKLTGAERPV